MTIKTHLEPIPVSRDDAEDAIDKAHTQNTDTKLDEGGDNEISASEINDQLYAEQETGTEISFARPQVYNSPDSPGAGDITEDLTGAVPGIIQKIYHQDSASPSVPGHWVTLSGAYYVDVLNIIYAEYVSDSRVELWITQEVE